MIRHTRSSIFVLIAVLLCNSCNTCSRHEIASNLVIEIEMADFVPDSIYINMGKKVLYILPTPIEASMLIKNWGVPNTDILNDPANASKYLTKKKMALNFGVYITDMTTAGLYEQPQTVLRYKDATLNLIDGLGLQSAIDPHVMQMLDVTVNDKTELLTVISDIYASCTSHLSDDDRDFYALAVLTGGWVEGMYIATSMIDENKISDEEKMKQLVNDNKLVFDLLWNALGNLDVIPDEAVYLMLDMSYVAHLLGHKTLIQIPQSENSIDNVTPKFFAELKSHIQQLRQQFTKI